MGTRMRGYLLTALLINNPAFDTDQYLPPALRWHVKKITTTDRVAISCHCNYTNYIYVHPKLTNSQLNCHTEPNKKE